MGVSKVNKLKDLIHELCPNGVEYKKLANCCVLEKGSTPIQKAIPGEFPLVVTTEERKSCNTYQFEKPTVCIPLVSSRGHGVASLNRLYYQEGKFALGNILCGVTPINSDELSAKFLFYYLNHKKDTLIVPLMRGGANVSLTVDSLKRISVPVPPIPVQNEIIRIFDKFEALGFELAGELIARKKQYEYYQDKLINEAEGEKGKLIDILAQPITDGPHTTPILYESGVPFVSATAVYNGKVHLADAKGFISKEFDNECAKKYKPRRNDVFMVKSGSTTGKVAIVDFDDDFNVWSPLAAMRTNDKCFPRYLYHMLQTLTIQEQVQERMSHGSQPNLSMRVLEQFDIVIPPKTEQLRILEILSGFDKICNDVYSGLPAEIEARQKQYEYYRDKLLSFKEKE